MNSRHITYLFVVINEIEYAKLVKFTFINKQVAAIYTICNRIYPSAQRNSSLSLSCVCLSDYRTFA